MPPGENANFTRNLIGGVLIAAVTAGAITLGVFLGGRGDQGGTVNAQGDDEERPPVIVSNGSVWVETGLDKNGNRGEFERRGNKWAQTHSGRGIVGFKVHVSNSSTAACNNTVFEADEVKVTYGKDANNASFTFGTERAQGSGKRRAAFEATDADWPDSNKLWSVKVGVSHADWKVQSIDMDLGSTHQICEFPSTLGPRVELLRLKQVWHW